MLDAKRVILMQSHQARVKKLTGSEAEDTDDTIAGDDLFLTERNVGRLCSISQQRFEGDRLMTSKGKSHSKRELLSKLEILRRGKHQAGPTVQTHSSRPSIHIQTLPRMLFRGVCLTFIVK